MVSEISQDISLSLLACVFEFCCDFDGSVKHEVKKMNFALENLGKNAWNMFYKITKRRAAQVYTSHPSLVHCASKSCSLTQVLGNRISFFHITTLDGKIPNYRRILDFFCDHFFMSET